MSSLKINLTFCEQGLWKRTVAKPVKDVENSARHNLQILADFLILLPSLNHFRPFSYFFLFTFQLNLWGRVEVTTTVSSLLYIRDRKVGQVTQISQHFPMDFSLLFVILRCSNMKISGTTKTISGSVIRKRRFFKTNVADPCHSDTDLDPRIQAFD